MIISQRYRDNYTLLFILGFLILVAVKAAYLLVDQGSLTLEFVLSFLLCASLLFVFIQFFQAKLLLKIKRKKIVIKLSPLPFFKVTLKKDQIIEVDFFHAPPLSTYSGGLLHFGSRSSVFNFGGNKVMVIKARTGETYYFVSEELYLKKDTILSEVEVLAQQ